MATASQQIPTADVPEGALSTFEDLVHLWNSGNVDTLCYDAQRTTLLTISWGKGNVDHAT
jgi:hypothetical protein